MFKNFDINVVNIFKCAEKERTKLMAKQIIRQAIKDDHVEMTLEGFKCVEPFMYYIDEIMQVYAEVKING